MFKFKVSVYEYERGWGKSLVEVLEFDTYEEAIFHITTFNSQNTSDKAPDWYMQAEATNFTVNSTSII